MQNNLNEFPVYKVLFSLLLLLWGSWVFLHVNSQRLQKVQVHRTLGVLKSLSQWQRELLAKKLLPSSFEQLPQLELQTVLPYYSQDTYIFSIVWPGSAYLLALVYPLKLDAAAYGIYVDTLQDKVYCVAQQNRAAEDFCRRLGADVSHPVETSLSPHRILAGYQSYAWSWGDTKPLIDEPVPPLRN